MLTKKDLQQISTVIDERLDKKLDEKLDEKLKPIKRSLRDMNRRLTTTINFFDQSTVNHEKRIKRVEKHLDLPSLAD